MDPDLTLHFYNKELLWGNPGVNIAELHLLPCRIFEFILMKYNRLEFQKNSIFNY